MKIGYAILYANGELVISKNHTILSKKIYKDYGAFEDISVPWRNDSKRINKVNILDQVKSNCMKEWFDDCTNLTSLIDFTNLDVSDCTDFLGMFYSCRSLQDISALASWNVSNGKNFSQMFRSCTSLQNISLQNTLRYLNKEMFEDCNPNLKIRWKDRNIKTYKDELLDTKKLSLPTKKNFIDIFQVFMYVLFLYILTKYFIPK